VKGTRGRYRQSGARTDESDALLLADVLRTDRGRFQPWHPDDALTRQMRVKVSLHVYLTQQTTRFSNRLRAVLVRYYPAATQVFSGLKTQIALHFVQEFPTPHTATQLTFTQFKAFAKAHGYSRPKELPACFARLQQAQPEADPTTIAIYESEAVALAAVLLNLVQTQLTVARELVTLFELHPDYPIFHSLPGAGAFLGLALLVKFGNDRVRFPMPASVQALAGTCPITDHSGKRRIITPAPHRQVPGSSGNPATGSFAALPNNGPSLRWPSPLGPRAIGCKLAHAANPIVMPFAAWPTAGWLSLGRFASGKRGCHMMKTTICSNVPRIASRAPNA
jgi:transposase